MIRVVLDTNVIVSGILSPKGAPARVLRAWLEERFDLVTSEAILEELRRVLSYPKIKRHHGWSDVEVREFVEDVAKLAILVPGELKQAAVAEDPSDDRYLECALEGKAEYVVSGDRHLKGLAHFEGVEILSPGAFLAQMS